jgi:hypothetical protein
MPSLCEGTKRQSAFQLANVTEDSKIQKYVNFEIGSERSIYLSLSLSLSFS